MDRPQVYIWPYSFVRESLVFKILVSQAHKSSPGIKMTQYKRD